MGIGVPWRAMRAGGLATQFAICAATDGKRLRSAAQLHLLRNFYAVPETDPMFPGAVADLLETPAVLGPAAS